MFNRLTKKWVIIPAAGSGQRMKASVPKQYLKIKGKAILEHTLSVFESRDDVSGVRICVAQGDDIAASISTLKNAKFTLVQGSDTRAKSVLNGLLDLNDVANDNDWVLVHDAARPCLSTSAIQRLFDELEGDDVGGILAIQVKDTLKLQSKLEVGAGVGAGDNNKIANDRIEKTLDRSMVWQAQTPQMFRFKLLKDALHSALEHNVEITDEASALEIAGYQPRLIHGETRNLKITTPEDLELAEFLLDKH